MCENNQDGYLHLYFRAYDMKAVANHMSAIDENNVDISGCASSGSIRETSPYVVDTIIDMQTQTVVSNDCAMTVVRKIII